VLSSVSGKGKWLTLFYLPLELAMLDELYEGLLLVSEPPYREMRCRMRFEFAGTERLGL
jgi:hypothetical protein